MNRNLFRTLSIALITLLLGCGIDFFSALETKLGLDYLFTIRGIRTPPAEVVVIAMDEVSETRLNVGQDLRLWRGFHAQLLNELRRQGAALMVFDLQFIAAQADQDKKFAAAMRAAGNVLIADCVQKLRRGVEDFYGRDECSAHNQLPFVHKENASQQALSEQLIAMRKVSATPLLLAAALDHAPFYLSNDAVNATIREGWTFLDALAEAPTLPVLAWVYYVQHAGAVPHLNPAGQPISAWLTAQRRQCRSTPENVVNAIQKQSAAEQQLTQLICAEDAHFLNFYGPPQTIRMLSYADVYAGKATDLQGKVVFIGKANRQYSPGKTDYFQTPFSDTRSGKMAGVEIMATQFANLLENRSIHSVVPPSGVILAFGLFIGVLLTQFPGLTGILTSLLVSGTYLAIAVRYFQTQGIWLPIAVPLLIQLPLAWLMSLLWSRYDLLNERKRILAFVRHVFPQWLHFIPASPGQWYPEKSTSTLPAERDVYGLCLATDIEGYTTVAAQHTPNEMWQLLNAYYQVLGHPVTSHDGIIADVTGDAMMSVWLDLPIANQRLAACLAALEMELEVERFNKASRAGQLPTRIGLHEGEMTLGKLAAGDGSYYRAIGDTVNTASRIQGVNKYLGTRILACATITIGLTHIVYRPVGVFGVVGRDEPLNLVEIVGTEADANASMHAKHRQFAAALSAFQQGRWPDAALNFTALLQEHGEDGPSRFYLALALAYKHKPPLAWDGVVLLDGK